ncbi:MAG: hypothetical protein FWF90_18395, partial [Promicromonosporaceae bacterium]|nr:hypothetical protein [Promicromonosporaceae bacterium]
MGCDRLIVVAVMVPVEESSWPIAVMHSPTAMAEASADLVTVYVVVPETVTARGAVVGDALGAGLAELPAGGGGWGFPAGEAVRGAPGHLTE